MSLENELSGLKYFVSKKIEEASFSKKTGFFQKIKTLNKLKKENSKTKNFINIFFIILGITLAIPLFNFIVALFSHENLFFIGKEIVILLSALIISYLSLNLINNNYKNDIRALVIEKNLPNITLNESDMLEIGMYLSNEEKEDIATKIYKEDAINLLTINEIIDLKERMTIQEKKKKMVNYLHQI